jgi:hypothetical protein
MTAAAVAAAVLGAVTALLLGEVLGTSPGGAVLAGAGLTLALGAASLVALLWGRRRSNQVYLASLLGVIAAKMVVVGAALAFVWTASGLPRLEFVAGLLAGWVIAFAAQAGVLHATARRPQGAGR